MNAGSVCRALMLTRESQRNRTKFGLFWATVCKTVCPILSARCLSVLSVTFVYLDQSVGRIKLPLGVEIGLGPGHIVLSGDPAPPPRRGTPPQFSAHICCGQMAGWIKMPLGVEVSSTQATMC